MSTFHKCGTEGTNVQQSESRRLEHTKTSRTNKKKGRAVKRVRKDWWSPHPLNSTSDWSWVKSEAFSGSGTTSQRKISGWKLQIPVCSATWKPKERSDDEKSKQGVVVFNKHSLLVRCGLLQTTVTVKICKEASDDGGWTKSKLKVFSKNKWGRGARIAACV